MSGRHLKSILALSVTFFIVVGIAGCSLLGWTSPAQGSLVGTWKFTSGADYVIVTLNSNLTFSQTSAISGPPVVASGNYTSDASSIVFTVLPGPTTETDDYSLSPNGNSLVLIQRSTSAALFFSRQ
jgi:hypothetical protein